MKHSNTEALLMVCHFKVFCSSSAYCGIVSKSPSYDLPLIQPSSPSKYHLLNCITALKPVQRCLIWFQESECDIITDSSTQYLLTFKLVDPMDFRGQIFSSGIIAQGLSNYKDMLVGSDHWMAMVWGPFTHYKTLLWWKICYSTTKNCWIY